MIIYYSSFEGFTCGHDVTEFMDRLLRFYRCGWCIGAILGLAEGIEWWGVDFETHEYVVWIFVILIFSFIVGVC